MKSYSKNISFSLKFLLFSCMLIVSLSSIAQRSVILDPALREIRVTDLAGNQINENFIQPGQLVKLVIPVVSINQNSLLPKGSCKIKIGLGSKLILDPAFDLTTVNSGNYFTWSVTSAGGQSQLTGELTSSIPANFQEIEVAFKVKGNVLGHSTITANFLITNHNTTTILSDSDGSNNAAFLKYAVTNNTAPNPVTNIDELVKSNCVLKVNFSTDHEININSYQIEVSKNGTDYVKVNDVNAANLASYSALISLPQALQAPVVYLRIKSLLSTGSFLYSNAKSISGICSDKWLIDMYPNPVKANGDITIRALEGSFDGKYTLTLLDMSGRILGITQKELNNVSYFTYKFGTYAAGKYMIKLVSADGVQSVLLHFEKL
jgi:hypothetical protein